LFFKSSIQLTKGHYSYNLYIPIWRKHYIIIINVIQSNRSKFLTSILIEINKHINRNMILLTKFS